MKKTYEDFHELIIYGHRARLTPEQIRQRFIAGGLAVDTLPSAQVIKSIGCSLIGPSCRWRSNGKMTAWQSGIAVKGKPDHLRPTRKVVD